MDPGPSYTVLRIKRKATEQPLSAFVIQDELEASLARPKKQRREKPGAQRGMFRLAETVPDTWQGKGAEGDVLRERIKGLLSTAPARSQSAEKAETHPPPTSPPDLPNAQAPEAKPRRMSQSAVQYRVVPPSPRQKVFHSMLPPKVMTYAEERQKAAALNFVDAEAVSARKKKERKMSAMTKEEEKDMAAFLPMLEEYLSLESPPRTTNTSRTPVARLATTAEEEKYVYDLYYRDIRPETTSLGLGVGDGVNIGALLGYNDDSPSSSPDNSEPEDEADEDSNDEDYYRNDYPEDEDADEDMQGYKDAFDDDEDDEEEEVRSEGERGEWDYR